MAAGGYAWWYLDALSDDGEHGLTIIAFIGSVFSPYYAWARRRGGGVADPLQHCAMNVSLYGRGGKRWAMTERGAASVTRTASTLQIGPSAIEWSGGVLTLRLDEVCVPWPRRLRGVVRVRAPAWHGVRHALDPASRHGWLPLAPCAEFDVRFSEPALDWHGAGYVDSNHGDAPLEADFIDWDWSRARLRDGSTAVLYDVRRRGAVPLRLAKRFDPQGLVVDIDVGDIAALPASLWRVARGIRSAAGHPPQVLRTLEDGPFYARSLMGAHWLGEPVRSMHESLSLTRFASPWVQAMLPFRMPRRGSAVRPERA